MLYHKIDSIYKRDPATNYSTFLEGEWSRPEFGFLADNEWVWTEKIDGTNIRLEITTSDVQIGGRTERAQIPTPLINHLEDVIQRIDLTEMEGLTLVGEGYGPGIQKGGGSYRTDQGFILFDVFVTENEMPLERYNVESIAEAIDIPVVPVIGVGTIYEAIELVWNGFYSEIAEQEQFLAEGLVLRPQVELLDRRGKRIITKIKHRDWPEG